MKTLNINPKHSIDWNMVVNEYPDFKEIIYYKDGLKVMVGNDDTIDIETGELFKKQFDRGRKFQVVNGVLSPIKNGVKIEQFKQTIQNSRKRALDNLFGYCLANDWDYFLTLTFSPEFVDRNCEEDIKHTYKKFRETLQYYNPDVKIFAVPERHPKSGQLHFHCLVGNIDLEPYLSRAINPHTYKPIYSNGRAVYNLKLFKFGFSTVVKCDDNKLKVVNYLCKYIIKDFGNIGYNKKTYYHTRNLNYKTKQFFLMKDEIYFDNLSDFKYRENSKMIVYRVPILKPDRVVEQLKLNT